MACLLSQANPSNLPPLEPISLPENIVGLPAKRIETEYYRTAKIKIAMGVLGFWHFIVPAGFKKPENNVQKKQNAAVSVSSKEYNRRGKRNK